MKSRYKCPSCECLLALDILGETGAFFIYCDVGRCPSEAANQGKEGMTETEAFAKLESAIEAEQVAQREGKG